MPELGGIDAYYALLQLVASRGGQRESEVMHAIVADFSDDDLRAAADRVGSLPRPSPPADAPDPDRMAQGAALAETHRSQRRDDVGAAVRYAVVQPRPNSRIRESSHTAYIPRHCPMPSLPHDLSSDFDADVQRWRDVYLRSDRLDADTLRDRLIGAIRPPWHDPRLGDQDESGLWTWFRLEREADGTVPHAQIVLHKVDGGLKLTNAVSGGSGGEFDRATYNRVVVDFHDRLVLALDKDDDVSLSLSAASASFADWVGEEAVEILARFSVTASRSSAMGYPGSEERWLHFLYLAVQHADAGFVDALRQVLVNNGWPDDAADELVSQAELVEAYERLGRERYRRTA